MLTLGAVLENLRKKRKFSEDNSAMSQADLYSRARRIENPPPKVRKGVGFPLEDASASKQAEKIREFERGTVIPTVYQLGLLEQALGLPNGLLSRTFENEADLDSSIENVPPLPRRAIKAPIVEAQQTADTPDKGSYWPASIDSVDAIAGKINLPVLSRNKRLIDKINASLFSGTRRSGVYVCYVHSESGMGKSHLLFDWYQSIRSLSDRPRLIAVNAKDRLGLELIADICQRVCGTRATSLNEILADKFRMSEPATIAVDHLVSPEDQSGELAVGLKECNNKIVEFINWAEKYNLSLCVILFVQTNGVGDDPLRLKNRLSPTSGYLDVQLDVLSPDEAFELAKNLGAKRLTDANLRKVCERTDRLPMTIEILCDYIKTCSDHELEDLIVSDLPGTFDSPSFRTYMASYMAKMDAREVGDNSHPIGLLRLIALMPGPTPITWLLLLVDELPIKRINPKLFRFEIENTAIPFLIRNDSTIDVHALARSEIRRDIEKNIAENAPDSHVTLAELRAIHLAMANVCRMILQNKQKIRKFDTLAIENLVFHLMEYRALAGSEARNETSIDISNTSVEERVFSGQASPEEIMNYCWEDVIVRYVIDRGHVFTQHLGQHERKINLLKNFFPQKNFSNKIVTLDRRQANEVLKELSICYTHLGHLNAALATINRSTEHASDEGFLAKLAGLNSWSDWAMLSDSDSRKMLSYFEAITHECIVLWRRGNHYTAIERILAPHRAFFNRVAAFPFDAEYREQRPLIRSCRRFIARDAHMTLFHGDAADALLKFNRAREIERTAKRDELTGEAGRRHMQAISRCHPEDPAARDEIQNILNFNLDYLARQKKFQQYDSIDEVSWLCARVGFERVQGKFEEAKASLEEARRHQMSVTGNLSFYARAELFMEECRLSSAMDVKLDDRLFRDHIAECVTHHHSYLAHEAGILRYESQTPESKGWLDQAETYFEMNDWYLKIEDISMLRDKIKPSKRFVT